MGTGRFVLYPFVENGFQKSFLQKFVFVCSHVVIITLSYIMQQLCIWHVIAELIAALHLAGLCFGTSFVRNVGSYSGDVVKSVRPFQVRYGGKHQCDGGNTTSILGLRVSHQTYCGQLVARAAGFFAAPGFVKPRSFNVGGAPVLFLDYRDSRRLELFEREFYAVGQFFVLGIRGSESGVVVRDVVCLVPHIPLLSIMIPRHYPRPQSSNCLSIICSVSCAVGLCPPVNVLVVIAVTTVNSRARQPLHTKQV